MIIRNKKTGETIDLSEPSTQEDKTFESRSKETDKRIAERGTIQDSARKIVTEKSSIKKVGAGLEVASAPLSAIESGISNPGLQLQKGNSNPVDLMKEAILGLTLQKQGQYGDIMKNAGYNPILSDAGGLILNLSPVKVYSEVAKTFGNISKMSDKALEKTGKNLIDAVTQARDAVGTKVTQEYAKGADSIPVDGLKFLDTVATLPKVMLKKVELKFGSMEDFANGLTVGKVREFKRLLGKLKPNAFGNEARGVKDSLDVKDINEVYGKVSGLMESTLRDPSSKLSKSVVDNLLNLDESFHDVVNAGRYIRKTIMDSTLGKPTKVGELAEAVTSTGNTSARTALNTVKKASFKAMLNVTKAMRRMESFNRWQAEKQIMSRTINAVTYGGVAGAIGGKILRQAQQKYQEQ